MSQYIGFWCEHTSCMQLKVTMSIWRIKHNLLCMCAQFGHINFFSMLSVSSSLPRKVVSGSGSTPFHGVLTKYCNAWCIQITGSPYHHSRNQRTTQHFELQVLPCSYTINYWEKSKAQHHTMYISIYIHTLLNVCQYVCHSESNKHVFLIESHIKMIIPQP